MSDPLTNGPNGGRDPRSGRFLQGHKFAKGGHPHAARAAALMGTLLESVTDDDVREVWKALTAEARSGDVAACRVWLSRVFGEADVCSQEIPSRARLELLALLDGDDDP